jgi:hypothetical protein
VAAELESQGHQVVCPELAADNPEASSAYYVEAATSALRKISDPPIVVAHSVSGLFLPLIANGKSALQQLQSDPEMICPEWIGKDPTWDTRLAMKFLFHGCRPEVAEWALTTLRLMYAHGTLAAACGLEKCPEVSSS